MKGIEVTYGQLEKVLRAFGFTCRPGKRKPPGRIYQHESGAVVAIPAFPESQKVYQHHLVAAEIELDNFGIADAATFNAKLQTLQTGVTRASGFQPPPFQKSQS